MFGFWEISKTRDVLDYAILGDERNRVVMSINSHMSEWSAYKPIVTAMFSCNLSLKSILQPLQNLCTKLDDNKKIYGWKH